MTINISYNHVYFLPLPNGYTPRRQKVLQLRHAALLCSTDASRGYAYQTMNKRICL